MRHEHEARAWLAWHTAALHRAKKMPALRELTGARRPASGIDEAGLKATLAAYQARRERQG